MQSLKYAGLVFFGGICALLTAAIFGFLFSITIPLPLTKEQRAEISVYAPETDGVAVFQTELWRVGHNAKITMTEVIAIRRQGNQVVVDRYWFPHISWDVIRTIRERRLKQRIEESKGAQQIML